MNRGFKNYVVLIPASDKRHPSPLRVPDDRTLGQLVGRYVGEGEVPYSVGIGLVMRCRTSNFGAGVHMNFIATELLGINGKTVYGDAILCRFTDDYILYEKKEARAVAEAIDLMR